jgi:ATP-dependent RNA helicase DDX5/DBP2
LFLDGMGKRSKNRVAKRKRAEERALSQAANGSSTEAEAATQPQNRVEVSVLIPGENGALFLPAPLTAQHFDEIGIDDTPSFEAPSGISAEYWHTLRQIWKSWSSPSRHNLPIRTPTLVQLHSWPVLLSTSPSRYNLIQLAPTGSGKTLAYGLPLILHALELRPNFECGTEKSTPAGGLVIVPTRELARQVAKECTRAIKCLADEGGNRNHNVSVVALYGGVERGVQEQTLKQIMADASAAARADRRGFILTATPGRLLDLLGNGKVQVPLKDTGRVEGEEKAGSPAAGLPVTRSALTTFLSEHIRHVVLDEADRLAIQTDLCEQINEILCLIGRSRQTTCLCSATWPDKAQSQWNTWVSSTNVVSHSLPPCVVVKVDAMKKKARPQVEAPELTTLSTYRAETSADVKDDTITSDEEPSVKRAKLDLWSEIPAHLTQTLHVCAEHKKPRKLLTILQRIRHDEKQSRQKSLIILFFARIKTLLYMHTFLTKERVACLTLHSQLKQHEREQAVRAFQSGQTSLLLATDIAARGIHVANVSFVINYDFPGNLEQYIHRCGRAGRNGQGGTVYSFFTRNLAPLAADAVALLESSQQWIDPNLRALAEKTNEGDTKATMSKRDCLREAAEIWNGTEKPKNEASRGNGGSDSDDDVNLLGLLPQISLRRASNVSDPSDDSSLGEDSLRDEQELLEAANAWARDN